MLERKASSDRLASQALGTNLAHERRRTDSQLLGRTHDCQKHGTEPIALSGLGREAGFAPLHIRPERTFRPVVSQRDAVVLKESPSHGFIFEQMQALIAGAVAVFQPRAVPKDALETAA